MPRIDDLLVLLEVFFAREIDTKLTPLADAMHARHVQNCFGFQMNVFSFYSDLKWWSCDEKRICCRNIGSTSSTINLSFNSLSYQDYLCQITMRTRSGTETHEDNATSARSQLTVEQDGLCTGAGDQTGQDV
ncbi:hypothetical protein HZ326_18383 [Fusarium oxysporum f. sp. albedinis]|nr:hypothetical protein HZ326_18383 [Fusarium oxysporum f. sp. albedinis]